MNDQIIILTKSIQRDLKAIVAIYNELEQRPLQPESGDNEMIVVAYHLHNLYNAFENIFKNIAATFENSVDDSAQWHAQLLERMHLNIMPLRPAVIDDAAYDALDELRRFRHLFRHAYMMKLDFHRLNLVMNKALALKTIYSEQFEKFLTFLHELA